MKRKADLFVKDLNVGDNVQLTRGIGRVDDNEKGVVTGKDDLQVTVKFEKGVELKMGDNGTRWLKKISKIVLSEKDITGQGPFKNEYDVGMSWFTRWQRNRNRV